METISSILLLLYGTPWTNGRTERFHRSIKEEEFKTNRIRKIFRDGVKFVGTALASDIILKFGL